MVKWWTLKEALLTAVVVSIVGAGAFYLYGITTDKNDVNDLGTIVRTNLSDVANQVKHNADITITNQSVVKNLKTSYNKGIIALDKDVTVATAFASWTNLSGTKLEGVVAGLNNGTKYLVLSTNADLTSDWTWVIIDDGNGGNTVGANDFSSADKNADQAWLTYREIYFLIPRTSKTTFEKIADANVWRIMPPVDTTLTDGTLTVDADLVQVKNIGETK